MANSVLVEHYDQIAKNEAHQILAPMVEKIAQRYLFIDRKRACEMLCISSTTFNDLKNLPQIRIIEHRLPGCSKVLYEPTELKKAVLSVME